MSNTKKVVVVVAVGAGLYVVYKLVAAPGSTLLPGARPSTTTAAQTNALTSLASALVGAFTSKPVNGPLPIGPGANGGGAAPVYGGSVGTGTQPPAYQVSGDAGSYGNQQAYNNYNASDTSGGSVALPAGVYGPAVPADVVSVDDGSSGSLWSSGV